MSYGGYQAPPSDVYHRSKSIEDTETGAFETEPAPTFPTERTRSSTADGQRTVQAGQNYIPPPSRSDLQHVVVSLTNDSRRSVTTVDGGQQQSHNDTGEGVPVSNKPAAGPSGVSRRNVSRAAGETTATLSVDQPDYVGISSVGKRFRDKEYNNPGITILRWIYEELLYKDRLQVLYFVNLDLRSRLLIATLGQFLLSGGGNSGWWRGEEADGSYKEVTSLLLMKTDGEGCIPGIVNAAELLQFVELVACFDSHQLELPNKTELWEDGKEEEDDKNDAIIKFEVFFTLIQIIAEMKQQGAQLSSIDEQKPVSKPQQDEIIVQVASLARPTPHQPNLPLPSLLNDR
ncbi:hypothetical protein L1987_65617 [Smallanthus sonchifolius]|uniref:Uncharacterized protein n=1 Tax=Smallanthus sonchifolius TaxID=185202 RepID=A0ACB9BUT4_9ASTR|nr:hypothetical protein L1987_65617 [Smallanthus sonchifolius]